MYNDYLLKIGPVTVPHKFFRAETYKAYNNMQDVDDWTDANGYLHRNPVDLKAVKVEFETPPMLDQEELTELVNIFKNNYVVERGREFYFTAYVPEMDEYVTQLGYLADFQPEIYWINNNRNWTQNNKIQYNAIKISIVGGLADNSPKNNENQGPEILG